MHIKRVGIFIWLLAGLGMVVGCQQHSSTEKRREVTQAPAQVSSSPAEESPASQAAELPTATEKGTRVLLGSPGLTTGIPGEGPLTLEEIKAWLDEPAHHLPLDVTLPQGLAAGATSIYIPEDNPLTRAKIELGRQLYFDRRLSVDGTVSCADCHHPDEGFARHTQFGVGVANLTGTRNSPASYNRILSRAQFWDGRAESLEKQALGPIANPIEMGNTHEAALETVRGVEGYRLQFEKIFADGLTLDNLARAIASFERALVTGPSPADFYEPLRAMRVTFRDDLADLESLKKDDPDLYEQYMATLKASEAAPISAAAQRGRELFFSQKGGCTACHVGANFSDEKYHNLGVGMDKENPDLGRFDVTHEDKDRGAFKTPTVRNVALTAPYMHDGSQATLAEVVDWYAKGGHPNPYLSKDVKKLNLSDQDKADLVEYMQALTGAFPQVQTGRLPQ